MAQDRVVSEVVGVVSAVHGNGFRLRDRDGFLNISRFCDPVPAMPAVGEAVAVGVDAKGYVRTIASVAVAGELDALDDRPVPAPAGPPNKDTQIRRMHALTTATSILASGNQRAEPAAVLTLAATLVAWVERPG